MLKNQNTLTRNFVPCNFYACMSVHLLCSSITKENFSLFLTYNTNETLCASFSTYHIQANTVKAEYVRRKDNGFCKSAIIQKKKYNYFTGVTTYNYLSKILTHVKLIFTFNFA